MIYKSIDKKKRIGMTKKTKDNIFVFCMLAIPMLHFLIFWLYVNFDSILMAFQVPLDGGKYRWSLDNFTQMFREFKVSDSVLPNALKNTFIFFFTNLLISFPLSFLLAYFLYKKVAGYKIFRVIFYLPSIVAASVIAVLFRYIIEVGGPLSYVLGKVGLSLPSNPDMLHSTKYALWVIIFYSVFFGLGSNLVLFSGAMSNIDSSVVEAAKIDGAGMTTEIFKITIPMMWPTLSTMMTFMFIGIFGASGPILLFTKGEYNTYTIAYWIFDRVAFASTLNYPAAVGLFFTMIGAPIALFMRWFLSRRVDDITM